MLYDKRWDAKTKADPLSLESLIAWLEKQPATKRYHYADSSGCALHQYFTAQGFKAVSVGPRFFSYRRGTFFGRLFGLCDRQELPPEFNSAVNCMSQTFGTALDRARKLAAA